MEKKKPSSIDTLLIFDEDYLIKILEKDVPGIAHLIKSREGVEILLENIKNTLRNHLCTLPEKTLGTSLFIRTQSSNNINYSKKFFIKNTKAGLPNPSKGSIWTGFEQLNNEIREDDYIFRCKKCEENFKINVPALVSANLVAQLTEIIMMGLCEQDHIDIFVFAVSNKDYEPLMKFARKPNNCVFLLGSETDSFQTFNKEAYTSFINMKSLRKEDEKEYEPATEPEISSDIVMAKALSASAFLESKKEYGNVVFNIPPELTKEQMIKHLADVKLQPFDIRLRSQKGDPSQKYAAVIYNTKKEADMMLDYVIPTL